jgi:hypothetical protein
MPPESSDPPVEGAPESETVQDEQAEDSESSKVTMEERKAKMEQLRKKLVSPHAGGARWANLMDHTHSGTVGESEQGLRD